MRYKVRLTKTDEGYTVEVPDLPGCISEGNTEADALDNIKDAIREYLAAVADLPNTREQDNKGRIAE
jgi:predicted RNase H-like HicB family nuclease